MKKKLPAYKDTSKHQRLSDYLRASLDDFKIAKKKKWVVENMEDCFCQISEQGDYCEVCLAGATLAVESKYLKDVETYNKLSESAQDRLYAIEYIRTGEIETAIKAFYHNGKGVSYEEIDMFINNNDSILYKISEKIKSKYLNKKDRAPLSTYYWVADQLYKIGL